MNATGVKAGDILHVDKGGRVFFAHVTVVRAVGATLAKDSGRYGLRPITKGITYRNCNPREVVGHYRRAKHSRVPLGVNVDE